MSEARTDDSLFFLQFLAYMGWTLPDFQALTTFEATWFMTAFSEKNKRERESSEKHRRRARQNRMR